MHLELGELSERGGQVAIAGVREDGDDELALVLGARGDLQGADQGGAGADAGEDALGGAQTAGLPLRMALLAGSRPITRTFGFCSLR